MFKHILVPLGVSDYSHDALKLAVAFAREQGARCTLVSVVDIVQEATPSIRFTSGEIADQWTKTLTDDANATIAEATKRYADSGVRLESIVVEGYPADTILEVAKECGADLIVMGSHGRSGVGRLLLGSVAETVVRTAHIPVLTVREM